MRYLPDQQEGNDNYVKQLLNGFPNKVNNALSEIIWRLPISQTQIDAENLTNKNGFTLRELITKAKYTALVQDSELQEIENFRHQESKGTCMRLYDHIYSIFQDTAKTIFRKAKSAINSDDMKSVQNCLLVLRDTNICFTNLLTTLRFFLSVYTIGSDSRGRFFIFGKVFTIR